MNGAIYPNSSAESSSVAGNLKTNALEDTKQDEHHEALDKEMSSKKVLISDAIEKRDVDALAELAVSRGGFLSDDLRQRAWPLLLGCEEDVEKQASVDWEALPPHPEEHQVELDVQRSFVYYPEGLSENQHDDYKQKLSVLIRRVLRKYPSLGYFQGFHDIAQVLLLVLELDTAVTVLERIAVLRLRDYMLPTLEPALQHLELIPAILHDCDHQLYRIIARCDNNYSLPAMITMYAHDIEEYRDVVRLFDFLLAQSPVMSMYLYAAIMVSRKEDIFGHIPSGADVMRCELQRLSQNFEEDAIGKAMVLYNSHPPETLSHSAWKKVPRASSLKTHQHPSYPRAMEDALSYLEVQIWKSQQALFFKQARMALRRQRKPAAYIFIAVLVGVASYWMMKNDARGDPLWKRWYLLGMQFCMRFLK